MRKILLLAVATCAPTDFQPASIIDTVRVLAVSADRSIAAPGEKVTLDALVADPNGNGRALRFAYGTCINPGSGEIPECAAMVREMKIMPVDFDGIARFEIAIPTNVLSNVPIGTVGVVFAVCAGSFVNDPRQPGSPVGCTVAGKLASRDAFVWGMKRITIIPGVRNENPNIVRVYFDGRRWDEGFDVAIDSCGTPCPLEKQHQIDVEVAPGSAEPYLGRTEDVVAFFYASQGVLKDEVVRSDVTRFTTIYAPSGVALSRPLDFWFVVRDDRGGMSFVKRSGRAI